MKHPIFLFIAILLIVCAAFSIWMLTWPLENTDTLSKIAMRGITVGTAISCISIALLLYNDFIK
jgi:hypothetical protein